ncbi:DUF6907 domain-containing protein [Streptomyces sp. NPDC058678]|uniref:DUF6907 domain-containing protein n=1 Tax=Streptomyces sp. NPDC058678 TaxID=3346595 RepID=UPI0036636084
MPNRTVTLPTLDYGPVTLAEPAWCAGHDGHRPGSRADLTHISPETSLAFEGLRVGTAVLFQAPYATIGASEPRASVHLDYEPGLSGLNPSDLYDLAAAMDTGADQLRSIADQLTAILGGGQ